MQESRYDGEVLLTDCVTQEQIERAIADPRNKTVALHRPGSAVTLPDGSEYVCQANGSWVRTKKSLHDRHLDATREMLRRATGEEPR